MSSVLLLISLFVTQTETTYLLNQTLQERLPGLHIAISVRTLQVSNTLTPACLFVQWVSTVVLGTDANNGMFIFLVRQYRSTRDGQLITACSSSVQWASTLMLYYLAQTQLIAAFSSFFQGASTLVLKYLVQKTHHGSSNALVRYHRSTRHRHSPRHVYLISTLVPQYSARTTHHGLFFLRLVSQSVSDVALGTDTFAGMFICLVRQHRSTQYGQLITACSSFVQCANSLVLQYLVQTTHHSLFFIYLVRQYVSIVVLGTDNSSGLVPHLSSALVRQYRSTRYRHSPRRLFAQCVSTVALDTDNSSRLVLHLFSVPVHYYCSTWYRQLITARFLIGLVGKYVSTVVLGIDNSSRSFLYLFSALLRLY